MNLQKLSNRKINTALVLSLLVFGTFGCSKNEKSEKYVLKINNAVLTEEQIKSALSDERNSGILRSEFIQNWIEKEILFQEAVKNGIIDGQEFKSIMDRSKKELAGALLINKFIDQENTEPSIEEIQKYFENYKDDFKLTDDLFRINIVYFDDFDKAVQFRNSAFETSWKNLVNSLKTNNTYIAGEQDKFLFRYQLQPLAFLRSISALQKDEISTIIETEPGKFAVVQFLEKLGKDIIPPLAVVREEVKTILSLIKKKEIKKKYIDKLIADHNLEIKRYSE